MGFSTRVTDKSKGEFPILVNPTLPNSTYIWRVKLHTWGLEFLLPFLVLIKMQTSSENGNSKTPLGQQNKIGLEG